MNFKKAMAVTLAAATAFASGGAYSYLSPKSANAGTLATEDTVFTVTEKSMGSTDGVNYNVNLAMTYRFNNVATTTGTSVTLTDVSVDGSLPSDKYLKSIKVAKTTNAKNASLLDKAGNVITDVKVTGVELNSEDFADGEYLQKVDISDVACQLTDITMRNFNPSDSRGFSMGVTSGSSIAPTTGSLVTLDFAGSNVNFGTGRSDQDIQWLLINNQKDSLETFNVKDLATDKLVSVDLSGYKKLKSVNVADNSELQKLILNPEISKNNTALVVDISNTNDISELTVQDSSASAVASAAGTEYGKSNGGLFPGIRFIQDGSSNEMSELDLSGYAMRSVNVNYANLTSFKAPGRLNDNGSLDINVSNNSLSNVDLSAARGSATSINLSNNKLADIDLSGQDTLQSLDISDNYLTSLDISGCTKPITSLITSGNFIAKTSFVTGDVKGKNITNQLECSLNGFTITGEGGLADADNDGKGYIRYGKTADVEFAMAVAGAPKGFADKLAASVTFSEANNAGGSIASLGEPTIKTKEEIYDSIHGGYTDIIVVSVPVTAASERQAAEKLTVNYGGASDSITIAAEDVAIVKYDITTNMTSERVKTDYPESLLLAHFDYPQVAGVLQNGTAKVKTASKSPYGDIKQSTPSYGLGYKLYAMLAKTNSSAAKEITVGTGNMGYKWVDFTTGASTITPSTTTTDSTNTTGTTAGSTTGTTTTTSTTTTTTSTTTNGTVTNNTKAADANVAATTVNNNTTAANTSTTSTATTTTANTTAATTTAPQTDAVSYKTGKNMILSSDVTLFANYTDITYNISYNGNGKTGGSTDRQQAVVFNADTPLSNCGFEKRDYSFEGWTLGGNAASTSDGIKTKKQKVYGNGESVRGLVTSGNAEMHALWINNNAYVYPKENTIELILDDPAFYTYKASDLDPYTNDGESNYYDQKGTKLKGKPSYVYFSSNPDVVEVRLSGKGIVNGTYNVNLVAKEKGAATVYVYDKTNEALASVIVNVKTLEEVSTPATPETPAAVPEMTEEEKQEALNNGEIVHVKGLGKVVKNTDGENTVTLKKGVAKKTLKINTFTLNGTTYKVTAISANAYKGKKKIVTLVVGNNVKTIGKAAFANCKKLKKATLGKNVKKIGAKAFKGDKKLKTVVIKSKKLKKKATIGTNAFKGTASGITFKVKTYKTVSVIDKVAGVNGWYTNYKII